MTIIITVWTKIVLPSLLFSPPSSLPFLFLDLSDVICGPGRTLQKTQFLCSLKLVLIIN